MFRIDTIYTPDIVARRLLFWSPSTGTFFLRSFAHNNLELDDIKCLWIEVLFPKSKSFFIGFICRSPDLSKHLSKNVNCKLESMLTNISLENKECILSVIIWSTRTTKN